MCLSAAQFILENCVSGIPLLSVLGRFYKNACCLAYEKSFIIKMRLFTMFITAVCVLFLINLHERLFLERKTSRDEVNIRAFYSYRKRPGQVFRVLDLKSSGLGFQSHLVCDLPVGCLPILCYV